MKRLLFSLLALYLAGVACNLPFVRESDLSEWPTWPPPSVTEPPAPPPAETAPPSVQAGGISMTLASPLAAGCQVEVIPAALDENQFAPWELAPQHLRIRLPDYPLQGRFHQPVVYVYPAASLLAVNDDAGYNIKKLQELLDAGSGSAVSPNDLPGVFFFNAAGLFASRFAPVAFQNGRGVRWLTQYAQEFAPVNNHELFYLYQGMTADQAYYVLAVLPVSHPALAADDNPNAAVPPGGVPFPEDWAQAEGYYAQISQMLAAAPPDSFTPRLSELDALVRSLKIVTAP